MQEQKKGNRSMLQIAGPLFANPSNPASTACRLIFRNARSRPVTGLRVSHRPVVAPLVTHFETPVTFRHLPLQTPIFIHSPNPWRGSLLPLGVGAAEGCDLLIVHFRLHCLRQDRSLATLDSSYKVQPSGSKLPRHKGVQSRGRYEPYSGRGRPHKKSPARQNRAGLFGVTG